MKRTIKTAAAIFLALMMLCGTVTAFASTPADIEWCFYEGDENLVYTYEGEIVVGADAVKLVGEKEDDFVYCIFEAEETGYYAVNTTDSCWTGIPGKYENGVYYYSKDAFYSQNFKTKVYYLEAGEHIIGIDLYIGTSEEISIDFLGDITEFAFDEDMLSNLTINSNIYKNEYDYEIGDYYFETENLTVKFENGTDVTADYVSILVFTDEELTKGEYNVELGYYAFPYRQAETVKLIDVKDVIAKIEINDLELYTELICCYDGEFINGAMGDEGMTITYTDGTTEVIDNFSDYSELKNGMWVSTYYDVNENGELCFVASIADVEFVNEVCDIRESTVFEDLILYHAKNMAKISMTFEWMGIYFGYIFRADSIPGALGNVKYFFSETTSDWFYTFAVIARNTAELMDHLV